MVALGLAYRQSEAARALFPPSWEVEFSKFFAFDVALTQFWERNGDTLSISRKRSGNWLKEDARISTITREPGVIYAVSMAYSTTASRHAAWKSFRPWNHPRKQRPLVSEALLERLVLGNLTHIAGFLTELKSISDRVVVLESPPLRPHNRYFGPNALGEEGAHYVNAFGRGIVDREMEKLGIEVVESPAEAFAGEPRLSYLRDGLGSTTKGDYNHANAEYGALHLKALADCLKPTD